MSANIFVDTNVLVYCRDASEPAKQRLALDWMTCLWETGRGRLSFQVLQEFYVTVTEKLRPGLAPAAARRDVEDLLAWRPASLDAQIMARAWVVQDRWRLSWWDSLIVAAANIADCRFLLTEDLQEYQSFDLIRVINPFLTPPQMLA